jgi:hypothetical protein
MNSLYKDALGQQFQQLSPLLQRFHSAHDMPWQGEASISWSAHPVLRLLLRLGSLPREAKRVGVTVNVVSQTKGEIWQRNFGGQKMRSRQQWVGASLRECFGPVSLALNNQIEQGALHQSCSHGSLLGFSLPRQLNLHVSAREWQENDRFNFDVDIAIANRSLIRYTGWLRPQSREA